MSRKIKIKITIAIIIILSAAIYFSPSSEPSAPLVSLDASDTTLRESGTGADGFCFEDLLDAIEWVESRGDPDAIGANGEVGAYQISEIYVDDVNLINRVRHTNKYSNPVHYKYYTRESKPCSRGMVRTYLQHYGGTLEEMARKHNGGPNGHLKESTKQYWEKVKKRMSNTQHGTPSDQPKGTAKL